MRGTNGTTGGTQTCFPTKAGNTSRNMSAPVRKNWTATGAGWMSRNMDQPGSLHTSIPAGPRTGTGGGAIDPFGAGRGSPTSHGAGCLTITAAGTTALTSDGVGFRAPLLVFISGLPVWCDSTMGRVGSHGVLLARATTTMSTTTSTTRPMPTI